MNSQVVLHVIPGLGPGGAEHMLTRLVCAKRKDDITPVVADLIGGGELAATIRAAGVAVHDLGYRHKAGLPATLFGLTALIRQVRPVVIQSWLYYADLLSLWSLERSGLRDSTRLYWGVRCSDMDLSRYGRALRWAVGACASRSDRPDAVVANSYAGRMVHRSLGYAPRAFAVIPNGIDTGRFRPDPELRARTRAGLGIAEEASLAVHVARVDPMKDHQTVLALARAQPNTTFLLAGIGTQSLDVPPNVKALGKRTDVEALYAAADVAVSTSAFGEGFPNVVAEAMASGIPVIATNVGDAPRIVGQTGTIVAPRDIGAMSSAIRNYLTEPKAERRARAVACRQRIETHFSLERAVAAFDALHLYGALPADDPSVEA